MVYQHPNFPALSKKELDAYLDFLAKVLFNLNDFEVWEAENVFSEEDDKSWNKEVQERYVDLLEEKRALDDAMYKNR